MFGPKSYLHGGGSNAASSKTPVVYFDVRVDSPYKDLLLIEESQLESRTSFLHGKLLISLSEDIIVKKISMKLVGKFKLDFLQLDGDSGVTNIVKDRSVIFETNWANLLITPRGEVMRMAERQPLNTTMRSLSSPVVSMLMKKKPHSPHVLELPPNGFSGTPFDTLDLESAHLFNLRKGNYELPFDVTLPPDVCDTVEGLQSGSVLYHFEAVIDRPKSYFHNHGLVTYKYLRIFRTLAPDHMSLQQDVSVANTYVDKLQYQITLPSKAIPIGATTPINIELFPFRKGYRLEKIAASLVQFFAIQDSAANLYDDQIVINKQSMTDFGNLLNVQDNMLLGNTTITSLFQLPRNLKKITQDTEAPNGIIEVKHRISVQVLLRHLSDNKTLEIKANLPVLLYVSPDFPVQGRLVLFDNTNGNIHFRPNEFVDLFDAATDTPNSARPCSPSPVALALPPPNYQDRLKDCLINTVVTRSAPVSPRMLHATTRDHADYLSLSLSLSPEVPAPPALAVDGGNAPVTSSPLAPGPVSQAPDDERCQVPSYEQTMQLNPAYSPP